MTYRIILCILLLLTSYEISSSFEFSDYEYLKKVADIESSEFLVYQLGDFNIIVEECDSVFKLTVSTNHHYQCEKFQMISDSPILKWAFTDMKEQLIHSEFLSTKETLTLDYKLSFYSDNKETIIESHKRKLVHNDKLSQEVGKLKKTLIKLSLPIALKRMKE